MNENDLIDKLNTLQAQNIALTHALSTLMHALPIDKAVLRKEYEVRCATFQTIMLEQHAPENLQIQRKEFGRMGNIVFQIS